MSNDVVRKIRQATRRRYSAEDKIRIVLEGLRGEVKVTEICQRENISTAIYYKWSKSFLDAGKNGLTKDISRKATDGEVKDLKIENDHLKRALAETMLEVQRVKKSLGL